MMTFALEAPLLGTFRVNLLFLRGLIANPRGVASVLPSSGPLARCIAAQVDPSNDGLVVELGPGTGAVTRALLARGIARHRLRLIEQNSSFVRLLRAQFPGVCVEQGDALDVDAALRNSHNALSTVVSGLPLLNLKEVVRHRLIGAWLRAMEPGGQFIQLSFGRRPPVMEAGDLSVRKVGRVFRSLPPATVWTYSRPVPQRQP